MAKNPLTEERLTQLKDDAQTLLTEFGLLYLKSFGISILQRRKNEETDKWKLSHREWDSIPREGLYSGYLYMQTGEGPGSFGGWKKRFLVETQDYGIDIYSNEKAHSAGKKPQSSIRIAGYEVVRNVSQFYRTELDKIASALGISDEEAEDMTSFGESTFALGHPYRTNYVFQVREIKSPMCPCFGKNAVDPAEATDEENQARVEWLEFLERCSVKAHPRDVSTVEGAAFDLTHKLIPSKVDNIPDDWSDDGTEAEIILDLLMEATVTAQRDEILEDLKGIPMSFRITIWYKSLGTMRSILFQMIEPAWNLTQKASRELQIKLETIIELVRKVKDKAEEKIKSLVLDKIGAMLAKYVTPFIQPLMKTFDKPLQDGFQYGRKLIASEVKMTDLPQAVDKRNKMLNGIPREDTVLNSVRQMTTEGLRSPLERVIEMSKEVFADMNIEELCQKAEDVLLEIIDAAVNSIQIRLDNGEQQDDELLQKILKDYDYDMLIAKSTWMKDVIRGILIPAFKKLISPVTKPVIEQANNVIPEDMQSFLNIEGILDSLINFIIGEPIDKMVEAAYPMPK